MKNADIAIVGGSLTGAATALAAAQAGFRVVVVDQLAVHTQVEQGFDGRSYAMALTSVRLLKALGLWADLLRGQRRLSRVIWPLERSDQIRAVQCAFQRRGMIWWA